MIISLTTERLREQRYESIFGGMLLFLVLAGTTDRRFTWDSLLLWVMFGGGQ